MYRYSPAMAMKPEPLTNSDSLNFPAPRRPSSTMLCPLTLSLSGNSRSSLKDSATFRLRRHRGAQSETIYLSPEANTISLSGHLNDVRSSLKGPEELGSVEDQFDELGIGKNGSGADRSGVGEGRKVNHPIINSVDGSSSSIGGRIATRRKAVSAEELDQLWITDPKRAKRIVSNRESAACSKEKKARYVGELEHNLKVVEAKAAELMAELVHYKRGAEDLSKEDSRVKLQMQAVEHYVHKSHALNDTLLKEELEVLEVGIREITRSPESFNSTIAPIPSNPMTFLSIQQPGCNVHRNMQFPTSNHSQSSMSCQRLHPANTLPFLESQYRDYIRGRQGPDSSSKQLAIVKSEAL